MWFRATISVILIALGIGSPWLVRDWLDREKGGGATGGLLEKVTSLPERIGEMGSRGGGSDGDSGGPGNSTASGESTGSSRGPNPLAAKAIRVLRGFLPKSEPTDDLPEFPLPAAEEGKKAEAGGKSTLSKQSTTALAERGLSPGDPIFLRLFKEESELELWMRAEGERRYALLRTYPIADCSGRPGPKRREGDHRAPEGFYYVGGSQLQPDTEHRLGIDLGYPNRYDRHHGRTGGDLLVHGGERSRGSFVLDPGDMTDVHALAKAALAAGQPFFRVHAFPFRMTDERMAEEWEREPPCLEFWMNLKEGYDFFENVHYPPDVGVEAGRYVFRLH